MRKGINYDVGTFTRGKETSSRDVFVSSTVQREPVVITEFGCCTYKGAEDKGGYSWAIVDRSKTPIQLKGEFMRDESTQANYIKESLDIFKEENVDGTFVFTFVSQTYPYSENPLYDLDMASYSVVKTYVNGNGTAYKDMPWEPKNPFMIWRNTMPKYRRYL